MLRRRSLLIPALTALLLLPAGTAAAREVTGGGEGAFVPTEEERVPLGDGRFLRHYRSTGFVTGESDTNPFHDTEQTCSGTELLDAEGAVVRTAGHCGGTDAAGDVWWIWFRGDAEGGVWGLLDGTGKFSGMKGSGSMRVLRRWPNGKYTLRWEGRWQKD